MKKKFTLHLDALLVIVFLFLAILSLIVFQQSQLNELIVENKKLQWQSLEDSLNLDSQGDYIKKLQDQLAGDIKSD